jgi:multidrug transporter EmrE-like cation transporter
MNGYLFLIIAILGELIGTSLLKASQSFTKNNP